ncbi:formyltransferase family protein [Lachnobacterium bovis]|uniref:Methionyl-tRNA formyltransferase n=1 Tax=Lachnobacterium bovis DSM 14045 TaxID=1122142 RepID=A0A1H3L0X6_9FIRM|nr:formyltransferase family protein [Lachnobacterium bovis]SDY57916.1 Methionyl-tRNA formyltransferase [Lachnobacterium bovis DSM 14045]
MDCLYLVIGTGELAVQIAATLMKQGVSVVVFEVKYSDNSLVSKGCKDNNIEYKCVKKEELTAYLESKINKYKLKVISAVNTYIFPKDIVNHKNFFGINYHNSLLPLHAGMNVESHTIFMGDRVTGITWHIISDKIDKGKIICQKEIKIDDNETSLTLLGKQMKLGYETFLGFMKNFIDNSIDSFDNSGTGSYHKISDKPCDGMITLDMPDDQIDRFLRAYDYGFLYTLGKPKVLYQGKLYEFRAYKILKEDTKPYARIDKGNLLFKVKSDGRSYVLRGIKEI